MQYFFMIISAVLFQIFLGSVSIQTDSSSQVEVATSEYILHPEYDPSTLANDLGLIKLRLPITFNGERHKLVILHKI